eukprot:2464541-Alexandrium_andersonii.AAC.1
MQLGTGGGGSGSPNGGGNCETGSRHPRRRLTPRTGGEGHQLLLPGDVDAAHECHPIGQALFRS